MQGKEREADANLSDLLGGEDPTPSLPAPPAQLIPTELVKTRLDERINRAYEIAREEGGRRYVWQRQGFDNILISSDYPQAGWTEGWVVIVDPVGFAVIVSPEREEPI